MASVPKPIDGSIIPHRSPSHQVSPDNPSAADTGKDSKTRTKLSNPLPWRYTRVCIPNPHFPLNSKAPHTKLASTAARWLCRPADSTCCTWTRWYLTYIIYGRKCLQSRDVKFPLGVPGKALDLEIKPRLGVDTSIGIRPIIRALQSKLHMSTHTWKSEICLLTLILPESKAEEMVIYLSLDPR